MGKTIFETAEQLLCCQPGPLGASGWVEISQARVDQFADATDDHQWIHVDPERAQTGPFGACIAHGYLTLSLASRFLPEIIEARARMGVNYGVNRVRFPAPVRVGARVRGCAELVGAETMNDGSVQAEIRVTVEVEGESKPACVADTLSRFYF